MEALDRAHQSDFESRLADHLYTKLRPRLDATPRETVEELAARGTQRALRYGIRKENEIAALVVFLVELKLDRARQPEPDWVQATLAQLEVAPGKRVNALVQRHAAERTPPK